jgi:hypothetical protein
MELNSQFKGENWEILRAIASSHKESSGSFAVVFVA